MFLSISEIQPRRVYWGDNSTPKFGMLLSKGWIKRLGGSLQNDLSYATVPLFGGESKRLYREVQLAYIISDEKNPTNHPIYAIDTDFGACILHIEES